MADHSPALEQKSGLGPVAKKQRRMVSTTLWGEDGRCDFRMPSVYINHGLGPMPLLGQQPALADFLRRYVGTLPRTPSAIVVVSSNWQEKHIRVSAGKRPDLYFDYGGFPPETLGYSYPAPGNPDLARRIIDLLGNNKIRGFEDNTRGWDHAVFVPLKLMFPKAEIPVVAMSLCASQHPAVHIEAGLALQQLRDEGVLIVGSGMSFHNFNYLWAPEGPVRSKGIAYSAAFAKWLEETFTSQKLTDQERRERMIYWTSKAPSAFECHPKGAAEQLLPLFVCFGAGGAAPGHIVGQPADAQSATSDFIFSQMEFL